MADKLTTKEAAHGQKMIEIKVRFWTNDIADGKNKILPKHAWDKGVVRVVGNRAHGITHSKARPFNSLMEISTAIERCLIDNDIALKLGKRSKKYLSAK